MSFTQFNLHPQINAGIEALGYKTPTPIQMQSIPAIIQGRDVMGLAQTGTGKTAAFALPILQRLMNGPGKMVRALIVAPTRELAEQINESINEMSRSTKLKSVALYGGVSKNPQIEKLRQGAEIIVACPGRLLDLVAQGVADLSGIEVFVLDEADRMFDMGFLPEIRKITKQLPEKRQTLLFSATMPADIRSLAKDILHDPLTIRIGNDIPVSTVSHTLYPVEQHLKTALLIKLLKETDTESVLVFARTKHRTTRVAMQMKKAGFPVSSLQGDLSQNQRQTALNGFREGKYRILIATDIAARGIDVTRISHVINYDMPDTVEAYTHRIGRTGRATKSGDAFSFVTSEERDLVDSIEYVLGKQIARCTLEDFDYSRPAPAGSGRVRHPMRMPAISELPTRFRSSTPVKKTASYHMSPGASGRRSR
ncbi:DEAD/DEAH box helicase [Syntrophus aciditrophicus]|uniref:DEAD-box ATP-dependent RNA helicase RhpA n=1 Tax=Syntrophus aciditrophicus (strain SB) TaxID=56780 RepID=Q2LXB6_SYNAS|nr:DEAD/DEAH box helicase [Syntrophus aciditrophicus]ABC78726.1 ATP-dependent RNA helicase [Syntrophus aciditrophicus SB]